MSHFRKTKQVFLAKKSVSIFMYSLELGYANAVQ